MSKNNQISESCPTRRSSRQGRPPLARVIAGKFKHRPLISPRTATTHPMSERARQAIFNSLGSKVTAASVLDLYAGTGALGLEALSRGASYCVFVEHSPAALSALRQNLSGVNSAKILGCSVSDFLTNNTEKFDLIFIDPPYQYFSDPDFSAFFLQFDFRRILSPDGILVLSHPSGTTLDLAFSPSLKQLSSLHHAGATLSFFSAAA